jgi:predicted ATP-grasp superfamily ATP-dependent carboligase
MKTDVMLTYGWVRSTYAALMNFKNHQMNVCIGDCSKIGMSQWSRLKKNFFFYVDPLQNKDSFLTELIDLLKKEHPVMLLPSHDETEIIASESELVSKYTLLPIPSFDQLRLANNKSDTQELAQKIGLRTPRRFCYSEPEDILGLIPDDCKSVIRLRKGNSAKGVFYACGAKKTYDLLCQIIEKYNCDKDRYPVVQEYVSGEGWGVSCLYWEGERIAHFTHRRIREKTVTGGTSTLREHQPNEQIEAFAFSLLDKLQWHGLAMVEFKYDPLTDKGYFIEINPRLWGSIHLAISAGVEFPFLLYLCATRGKRSALSYFSNCKVKYPWRSRWYLGDCILAFQNFLKLNFHDGIRFLLPGGTDTYDDFNIQDPLAFVGEVCYYGMNFLKNRSFNPVQNGTIG